MVGLLAFANESSAPVIVFCSLAALVLGSWGWTKYREVRAEKQSQELRNLYASVHAGITNQESGITGGSAPRGTRASRDS
jgi:hypothetical protein